MKQSTIINGFIAVIILLYFIILVMLYNVGADWKLWLYIGAPLIAIRLVRAILIIKSK